MYSKSATTAELAAWGLVEADIAAVEIWKENIPAYELFEFMRTQWNVGVTGATGLRYEVAFMRLDRLPLSNEEYDDLLSCLRVMEMAAITAMAEARKD